VIYIPRNPVTTCSWTTSCHGHLQKNDGTAGDLEQMDQLQIAGKCVNVSANGKTMYCTSNVKGRQRNGGVRSGIVSLSKSHSTPGSANLIPKPLLDRLMQMLQDKLQALLATGQYGEIAKMLDRAELEVGNCVQHFPHPAVLH
jgi:hypothetical protein